MEHGPNSSKLHAIARILDDFITCSSPPPLYQLPVWPQIINSTYGHKTYYLIAFEDGPQYKIAELSNWGASGEQNAEIGDTASKKIAGILPLIHLKSFAFGNDLISLPFFDAGGVTADHVDAEKALLTEAVNLANRLKAKSIQLRQTAPIKSLSESGSEGQDSAEGSWLSALNCTFQKRLHKVRMLLELPGSPKPLWGPLNPNYAARSGSRLRRDWLEKLGAWNFWMTSIKSSP